MTRSVLDDCNDNGMRGSTYDFLPFFRLPAEIPLIPIRIVYDGSDDDDDDDDAVALKILFLLK